MKDDLLSVTMRGSRGPMVELVSTHHCVVYGVRVCRKDKREVDGGSNDCESRSSGQNISPSIASVRDVQWLPWVQLVSTQPLSESYEGSSRPIFSYQGEVQFGHRALPVIYVSRRVISESSSGMDRYLQLAGNLGQNVRCAVQYVPILSEYVQWRDQGMRSLPGRWSSNVVEFEWRFVSSSISLAEQPR